MRTLAPILVFVFCLILQQGSAQIKFIENKGQLLNTQGKPATDVLFYGDAGNVRYYIRKTGVSYLMIQSLNDDEKNRVSESESADIRNRYSLPQMQGWRTDMNWINSSIAVNGIGQLPYKHVLNYYNPQFRNGLLGIQSYEKVLIKNIYKGVDVLFYSKNNQLKYDYILNKGADPNQIKFGFDGAQNIKLQNDTLSLTIPYGKISDFIPESHALVKGKRQNVTMHFKQVEKNLFGIGTNETLGNFEKLVIDPAIWITYFGGIDLDYSLDIECDKNGNIYMTGYTGSLDFPTTPGAFQTTFPGAPSTQGLYLSKFSAGGNLLWSTFYSGTDYEESRGVCVDSLGFVYITGTTYSVDFPVTVAAYSTTIAGGADAFLVKFDSFGVRQWATYFGSTTFDIAHKVDKDINNNIWVTGGTTNNSFPTTAGGYDLSYNGGGNDVFLVKFSPSGSFLYGTFVGGTKEEFGIDVDCTTGFVGITGNTKGSGFPTTPGAYDAAITGTQADGFYTKFDLTGTLIYSTFIGGNNIDLPQSISYDGLGCAVIGGHTQSNDFPVTAGAYQTVYGGSTQDCFLTRFKADNSISWSTYYGNNHWEYGAGTTIDADNNIYLHSQWKVDTPFGDLPVMDCAFQKTFGGGQDNFIAKFDKNGDWMCMTYFGGTLVDAVDVPGACIEYSKRFIHLACYTEGDLPITPGAYQPLFSGYFDIGLAKLCSIGCGDTLSSVADFTVADSVCITFPVDFSAAGIACDTSLVTYSWSFPGGTPSSSSAKDQSVTYSVAGNYSATLIVRSPCDTTTKTMNFYVGSFGALTLSINASEDTICSGTPVTITSIVGAGTPPYHYQWSTGAADTLATLNFTPTSSGPVTLLVSNPGACPGTATVNMTVLPTPDIVAPPDTCICDGSSITLTATGAAGYNWNTGETTASITITPNVPFTYVVSYSNGVCGDSDSTLVCVNPVPTVFAYGDTLVEYNSPVTIYAFGTAPLSWNPVIDSCFGCDTITFNATETATYTVTATNIFGCTATDEVTVTIFYTINVPNIITPNNDGLNDVLEILGMPPNSSMKIFNRWGNEIYSTSNYRNDWSVGSDGVYYYILNVPDDKVYTGFVHVNTGK